MKIPEEYIGEHDWKHQRNNGTTFTFRCNICGLESDCYGNDSIAFWVVGSDGMAIGRIDWLDCPAVIMREALE